MATIDLVSNLLPGILSAEGRRRQEATQALTSAAPAGGENLLGGIEGMTAVAPAASQQKRNLAGLLSGITGIQTDVRSPIEKINAQLAASGVDMNTSVGLFQAAKLANNAGLTQQAIQLTAMGSKVRKAEEDARIAQRSALQADVEKRAGILRVATARDKIATQLIQEGRVTEANLISSATTAKELSDAFKEIKPGERFLNLGGGSVFDTQNEKIISAEEAKKAGISGANVGEGVISEYLEEFPDYNSQFNVESWTKAREAFYNATDNEGREKALKMIRSKLDDEGAYYRLWPPGVPVEEQREVVDYRVGSKGYKAREADWNAFVTLSDNTYRNSTRALSNLRRVQADLEAGKAPTGITGFFARFLPGSPEYDSTATIETLLAEFGLSELTNLRASSVNGSSGLGQLTEKERQTLERRLGNLKPGISDEKMAEEIRGITESLMKIQEAANKPITKAEWMFGTTQDPREISVGGRELQTDFEVVLDDGTVVSGRRL